MTHIDKSDDAAPRELGLLLIDGFALMSYASLIEPFRAANAISGKPLYRWFHIGLAENRAVASNGARIVADNRVGDAIRCDSLFVFAAGDPAAFRDARTFAWLRSLARQGMTIAGISGGPYVLARAGLLGGYRATIHWEHRERFVQEFPLLDLADGLFVIDRHRVTCAGGTAALDLAVALIERDHGATLASQVSEWFIRTEARTAERPQRLSLKDRYGTANDTVLRTLAEMERTVESPLSRQDLARIAGVSPRQLDRLFVAELGDTVAAVNVTIRLEQARRWIRSTGMAMTEIAIASGFASASHFSRSYRDRFGVPPSRDRRGRRSPSVT